MMQTMSVLIHGRAKVGKSTLGGTAPPPVVIFDAEGSTKFLPLRMIPWNPVYEPAPAYDGTWDAAIVNVTQYADLDAGFQKLSTGQHHFRSLVLDSVSEAQRKLKDKVAGAEAMKFDHWDELLRNMVVLIRGFRDLTQHPTNPLMMAAFITETKLREGKYVPAMQGQISDNLPYWFDLVGYLWVETARDPTSGQPQVDPATGRTVKTRHLLVSPDNPLYEAGERVQGRLPDIVTEPDLSTMLVTVFPSLAAPQTQEAQA
jgi:hypothetical protein